MLQQRQIQKHKKQKCSKIIDNRALRLMVRKIRTHQLTTTKQLHAFLHQLGYKVCIKTVYRTLLSVPTLGLKRPKKYVHMLPHHKKNRCEWAREHMEKKIDWSQMWFGDEKLWYIDGPVYRQRIWQDIRDPPSHIPVKGRRNTAVSVFGAFSIGGVSKLVRMSNHCNAQEYCDTVKAAFVLGQRNKHHILYHDRCPTHICKMTLPQLVAKGIQTRLLPAKSPDLNPIENVWGLMSSEVYSGTTTYDSTESLWAAIQAAWAKVQKNRLLRGALLGSMGDRLRAVVDRRGGKTKF